MSAFLVSKEHIDFLIVAALRFKVLRVGTPVRGESESVGTAAGRMLWAENAKSVAYRYDGRHGYDGEAPPYVFDDAKFFRAPTSEPVAVLKAISCLDYQSCEHDGWQASGAKKFLDHLQSAAISRLPGYDAAPWDVRS